MFSRTIIRLAALLMLPLLIPAPSVGQARKVWTAKEILAERVVAKDKRARYCQGGAFKPCICASVVTKIVQYRPAVRECGRKAGIMLSGRYASAFSVVVRDNENKDRWPPQGINGCSAYERDELALNKCSAFKAQKVIRYNRSDKAGDATLSCLGASGYSSLFRKVRRMTIKLGDSPNSTNDPIARFCLLGPTEPLN